MRSTRRSRNLEATKEILYVKTVSDNDTTKGGFGGGYLHSQADDVWINCYLPWDFDDLVEAKLVMIPVETLTPMTLRIITNYALAGEGYNVGGETLDKSINTVADRITELDISDCLDTRSLAPKLYIGVDANRQASQNAHALVIGVRIRYNTPIYSHAP